MTELPGKQTEATFSGAKTEVSPDALEHADEVGVDDDIKYEDEPYYEPDVPLTPEELAAQHEVERLRIISVIESKGPDICKLYDGALAIIDVNKTPETDPVTFMDEDDSQWPNRLLFEASKEVVGAARGLSPSDFQDLPQAVKDIVIFSDRYFLMDHSLKGSSTWSMIDNVLGDEEKRVAEVDFQAAMATAYPEVKDMTWLPYARSVDTYGFANPRGLDEKPALSDIYDQGKLYDNFPAYKVVRPYLEEYANRIKASQEEESNIDDLGPDDHIELLETTNNPAALELASSLLRDTTGRDKLAAAETLEGKGIESYRLPPGYSNSSVELSDAPIPRHDMDTPIITDRHVFLTLPTGMMYKIPLDQGPYVRMLVSSCSVLVATTETDLLVAHVSLSNANQTDSVLEYMKNIGVNPAAIRVVANTDAWELSGVRIRRTEEYIERGVAADNIVTYAARSAQAGDTSKTGPVEVCVNSTGLLARRLRTIDTEPSNYAGYLETKSPTVT